jgi:predicted ATPase
MAPALETLKKIEHEYSLRDELDSAWAVRSLAVSEQRGQTMLVLEDPGGETLDQLLPGPIEITRFLRLAVSLATSLNGLHKRDLIHKDVKPANTLVDSATSQARLMGFGIASRLPRERQTPEPPEFIAGTLAYMAPEQTGRMNRSIDTRSDLYALGVTLYEMLTGTLPFMASDPMELVHCHIARQPTRPSVRLKGIPDSVSAIIMKLLAKTAEERYQTASGAASDLRRCLAEWETQHRIDEFTLGEQDTPDRLAIPEKLYGRESEIGALLASFDRVVADGRPELVLVSGYSGVGKSSVVNELHKSLAPPRGLFASGKFDQYKRDIPYSTLAQAFQTLTRDLLAKDEVDLTTWREALCEGLGPNGRLMIDLVSELKLIIGEQPPVPELPPQEAQRRFQLVLRRFIGVFAQPEHPLALFLDDLQWLDAATLEVLEDLLTQADVQHLLIVGAYRDNEVDAAHALARKLETIRKAGARVNEIRLAPLSQKDMAQLITDTLQCEPDRVLPLVQLVYDKTAGNPFFTIQFISALEHERLLAFDHSHRRWSWDLDRIHARGYTDNVVDLMITKLTRLPAKTQDALRQLACLGNAARATTLSLIYGTDEAQIHSDLFEATRAGMIERQDGPYRFVHDRVQEAAYSLIPAEERAAEHLRVGRLLAAYTPAETIDEHVFEIVSQFNRGAALITASEEREHVAELNLIAGKRAKTSTAYASALNYLIAGATLLPADAWERRHELTFALELNRAECEFLTGALRAAEQRLNELVTRAKTTIERASVSGLRVDLYVMIDQYPRAIAVGLDYLWGLGVEWSPHPTNQDVHREYERIWSQLGSRTIENLIELPLMTDAASLATMDVITLIAPAAFFTEPNLHDLAVCWAVNLSLERGNSDASSDAYVRLGLIASQRFGDHRAAYRFGQLAYELIEQRGFKRFQARTYHHIATHLIPCGKHVRAARDLLHRSFQIANESGDLLYASYVCNALNQNLLSAGDVLGDVQLDVEHTLEFVRKVAHRFSVDIVSSQLGYVRNLRGLTYQFGSFDDGQFDEHGMESHFSENPNVPFPEWWYWILKLQAHFHAGDYTSALRAARRVEKLPSLSRLLSMAADYHLFSALSHAASCDSGTPEQQKEHMVALAAHHSEFIAWAETCPENFENLAALVGAEIARLEGRELDAERLYEQAIRLAGEQGFIQNQGLAYELGVRF